MSTFGILVLISIACIAYGILTLLYRFSIIMRRVVVPGTVVGKWEQRVKGMETGSGMGTIRATPYSRLDVNVVVSFQPPGSALLTLRLESPLYSHPVGSQVQVIYPAGNPGRARVKEKESILKVAGRWIHPCLVLGLGLFIAFIFVLAPALGLLL